MQSNIQLRYRHLVDNICDARLGNLQQKNTQTCMTLHIFQESQDKDENPFS